MKLSKSKKIIFFSGSRSELDLILPLIKNIKRKNKIKSFFIISGTHLSSSYGKSERLIEKNIKIDEKIQLNLKDTSQKGITIIFEKLFSKFRKILLRLNPDLIFLVGDRYETLCLSLVSKLLNIKIIHMHGGEKTDGSIDDVWRHIISKLSDFHCVVSSEYKKRLIQLGEQPNKIFNYGSIGSNNFMNNYSVFKKNIFSDKYLSYKTKLLITYNSLSNNLKEGRKELKILLKALSNFKKFGILFTLPNHDLDANFIKKKILKYCQRNQNAFYVDYLGREKFIFYLKKSDIFIGNSSSGIIEAPAAKVPTLNIGNRQKGRVFSSSIFQAKSTTLDIRKKIKQIISLKNKNKILYKNIFYKKGTIKNIIKLINKILNKKISNNKNFYDIEF